MNMTLNRLFLQTNQSLQMKKLRAIILFTLLSVHGFFSFTAVSKANVLSILPDSRDLPHWQVHPDHTIYQGEELFAFMNGGAELYLEYGFGKLLVAGYQNRYKDDIQLELYRMESDKAAYGVFTVLTSNMEVNGKIDQKSVMDDGRLYFWKDRFLGVIYSLEQNRRTWQSIHELANSVSLNIPSEGQIPGLMSIIDVNGLIKNPVYFTGNIGSRDFYHLDSDLKGLLDFNEGVIGHYSNEMMMLLGFSSSNMAENALNLLNDRISTKQNIAKRRNIGDSFAYTDNRNNFIHLSTENRYIIIIISDSDSVDGLIRLKDRIGQSNP